MSYSHYDRLTALDASFLSLEDHSVHMHVGSVGLFDAAPLTGPHGGLDMERILAVSDAALAHHPRFRQKLAWVPLLQDPVWVDDNRFNLSYHVRHTALPPPGDVRQLKRLTGRIMSQQLDRGKPLWEIWFVEGVEGDRFAVISKMHHCMIDGVSGVDLMGALMGRDRDHVAAPSGKWVPRPAPTPVRLYCGAVLWHCFGSLMNDTSFNTEVARRLGCDRDRAEAASVVVLHELRDRLTPNEAADVAAQLPHKLKQLWTEGERADRPVRKIHRAEFVGRVRQRLSLADDGEAERTVKAVFGALQKLLGARSPMEGEAWDIFSQLPKDLKPLWMESSAKPSS